MQAKADNDSHKHNHVSHQLISLAKRIMVAVAIIWISLYLFSTYLAPEFGIKLIHLQITSTIITIGLSFAVVTAVRRLVRRTAPRIGLHVSAIISFFVLASVSLIAALVILHLWQLDLQTVLIGGGVAAIIIGIAISTIIGNILAGGLVLTTFPAKIGDSVFVVNDNIRGIVEEVNFMYTKVISDAGSEYIVPNSAIVQGNVRMIKQARAAPEGIPFMRNDHIQIVAEGEKYAGTVTRITPQFTFLSTEDEKEIVLPNALILSGKYIITKSRQSGKADSKTLDSKD